MTGCLTCKGHFNIESGANDLVAGADPILTDRGCPRGGELHLILATVNKYCCCSAGKNDINDLF